MLMLRYRASDGCAFSQLMASMRAVPLLGTDFNVYAPLAMGILSLFTVFNGYARLLRLVGIEHEDNAGDLTNPDDESAERVAEARARAAAAACRV